MKKSIWNTILKVVMAVATAIAGVIGGQSLRMENGTKELDGNFTLETVKFPFFCVPYKG